MRSLALVYDSRVQQTLFRIMYKEQKTLVHSERYLLNL